MDRNEFNEHINYRPINTTLHLYHGSKSGLDGKIIPNFRMARKTIDFGQGFYLGTNATQAKTLICTRDEYSPVLYKADINLTGLKCVRVDGLPWALLVAYNRGLMEKYRDTAIYEQIASIGAGRDVIVGPIADDRTSFVLTDFFNGDITDAALINCMGQLNIGTQYVAKTQAACDKITITDTFPLASNEIKAMRIKGRQRLEEGIRIVDPIKKRYRRTGRYFDEILEEEEKQHALDYPAAPPL